MPEHENSLDQFDAIAFHANPDNLRDGDKFDLSDLDASELRRLVISCPAFAHLSVFQVECLVMKMMVRARMAEHFSE
ncbi:MAG: hypothetical protein NZM26_03640 [Patescibacteria group bacterium]|nr:hypothetical protein [Patescibacteria group bacterium]